MVKKFVFLFTIIYLLVFSSNAFAQALSSGVALSVELDEPGEAGNMISYIDGDYLLSKEDYDVKMYGVITDNPVSSIENRNLTDYVLVVSEGDTLVKVSVKNGNIKKGDFITSSEIPGVGQKADRSGQILGVSLEDFESDNPEAVRDILVHVDIRTAFIGTNTRGNLVESLKSGFQAPILTPLTSFRYILAALVAGGAFVIAFASFGKTSGSGVEALGRNPRAKKTIELAMVFNFVLTAGIMFLGLLMAYIILVF